MVIIRTDGGGTYYQDDRLKKIREILNKIPFKTGILKLHDHKGILTVYYDGVASPEEIDIVQGIWWLFNEDKITHKAIEL